MQHDRQADAREGGRSERGLGRGGWRFVTPAVLLLLAQAPAHGYDLMARLGDVYPRSGGLPDPGTFYRVMRSMESEGAVVSSWETPSAGPARRVYTITDRGREQLDGWALSIGRDIEQMRTFLGAYEALSAERRATEPPQGEPR
jgi:PadR family transcriptional regulator, regulatory protein PadR